MIQKSKIFLRNSSTKKNTSKTQKVNSVCIQVKIDEFEELKIPLILKKTINAQEYKNLFTKQKFKYLKDKQFDQKNYQIETIALFKFDNKYIKHQRVSSFYYNMFQSNFVLECEGSQNYFFLPNSKEFLVLQFCLIKIKAKHKECVQKQINNKQITEPSKKIIENNITQKNKEEQKQAENQIKEEIICKLFKQKIENQKVAQGILKKIKEQKISTINIMQQQIQNLNRQKQIQTKFYEINHKIQQQKNILQKYQKKLQRIYNYQTIDKKQLENLNTLSLCLICESQNRQIVFEPCGHFLFCSNCFVQQVSNICFKCKQQIFQFHKIQNL